MGLFFLLNIIGTGFAGFSSAYDGGDVLLVKTVAIGVVPGHYIQHTDVGLACGIVIDEHFVTASGLIVERLADHFEELGHFRFPLCLGFINLMRSIYRVNRTLQEVSPKILEISRC